MAVVVRGKVIRGDVALWDGRTRTASRVDATGGTTTGLTIGDQVDVLQVYGDGTSTTRGTIANAVARIGSADVSLLFSTGTWTIDSSITIPANFTCEIPSGCVLDVATGVTLTINGDVRAGKYQIFSGSGTVSMPNVKGAMPNWWGAVGDGTNDTTALQAWLGCGSTDLYLPHGDYSYSALTLSANATTIRGDGILTKRASTDGRVNVTGARNKLLGLRFDGTAAATTPGPLNDCIRISGANNEVDGCYINGSDGCGIRIEGAAGNRITRNHVLNCYQTNIAVLNDGANYNLVEGNYISGCDTQNNIFVTADDGGFTSGNYVYGNIVRGNHCVSAFDTGIESGYHAFGTIVEGNYITGCKNPAILCRDGFAVNISGNVIETDEASQNADYSAIAVVPGSEAATFNYASKIDGNIITGQCNRAGIYLGGSGLDVTNNLIYDNETTIGADGSGLVGYGITMGPTITDIRVIGNYVRRFERGIDLNFDGTAITLTRVEIKDNTIIETATAINGANVTYSACSITDNKVKTCLTAVISTSSAVIGTELYYEGNVVDSTGFSGATPTNLNPCVLVLTAGDATPSVARARVCLTDSAAYTITDLDDGEPGQEVTLISGGATTYDTTGTDLTGSSVDIVTAAGDLTTWVCRNGTTWILKAFVDISVDNSGGA